METAGVANYLYNEDLDDDQHANLSGREKKKLRRAMREIAKERQIPDEADTRKPVVIEVFGEQDFETHAANVLEEMELVAFKQGRNWDFNQWKQRASFWKIVEKFKPDLPENLPS